MTVECLRVWKHASMEYEGPLLVLGWQLADGTSTAPSGVTSSIGARGSKMPWRFYPLRAVVEWRFTEGHPRGSGSGAVMIAAMAWLASDATVVRGRGDGQRVARGAVWRAACAYLEDTVMLARRDSRGGGRNSVHALSAGRAHGRWSGNGCGRRGASVGVVWFGGSGRDGDTTWAAVCDGELA
ncbi:hypothetical protein GUJ93_ZPchr0002g23932 [Zizania palustris]|uniref:Uncharacterized protein n=1 Tax=Zizania palustris TaxID=103762 RepID=A0A8J5SC23_ZIZPA|nr:hypothetical protein GUJ93_ZPchr0002g23932 [Zizania palustris]